MPHSLRPLRRRRVATGAVVLIALAGTGLVSPLQAQEARVDTAGLGTGPYARMHMRYERTIFRVDVLTIDIRLGRAATDRVESLVQGVSGPTSTGAPARPADHGPRAGDGTEVAGAPTNLSGEALVDAIAGVVLDARELYAEIRFLRDVGLDPFLDGVRESLGRAHDAGLVTTTQFEEISAALPGWYAFLADRGLKEDDRMLYRIRGDSLHTVYLAHTGEALLDEVHVGPERRLSVVGGYFAPDTDFRDPLVRSLLSPD